MMSTSKVSQMLGSALATQAAAARFYGALASCAAESMTRKLLLDLMRAEQVIEVQIESMALRLNEEPVAARPTASAMQVKTSPEWSGLAVTPEQALAIALDCTTRGARHYAAISATLGETAGPLLGALAASELERASVLEVRLYQRLGPAVASRSLALAVTDVLVSVRRAARAYERLASSASSPRARLFLFGMFEVCMLYAAQIDRYANDLVDRPLAVQSLLDADNVAAPLVQGSEVDMSFESAMQTAVAAQRRAALVHSMLARAYPGDGAELFFDIAEAERQHALTILSVLDRMYPPDPVDDEGDPSSPLANAPPQHWAPESEFRRCVFRGGASPTEMARARPTGDRVQRCCGA
jgi:rubrerythrin